MDEKEVVDAISKARKALLPLTAFLTSQYGQSHNAAIIQARASCELRLASIDEELSKLAGDAFRVVRDYNACETKRKLELHVENFRKGTVQ